MDTDVPAIRPISTRIDEGPAGAPRQYRQPLGRVAPATASCRAAWQRLFPAWRERFARWCQARHNDSGEPAMANARMNWRAATNVAQRLIGHRPRGGLARSNERRYPQVPQARLCADLHTSSTASGHQMTSMPGHRIRRADRGRCALVKDVGRAWHKMTPRDMADRCSACHTGFSARRSRRRDVERSRSPTYADDRRWTSCARMTTILASACDLKKSKVHP